MNDVAIALVFPLIPAVAMAKFLLSRGCGNNEDTALVVGIAGLAGFILAGYLLA